MAFPAGLKVLGGALTGVAEGLQAVPEYIDRDEELALKRELRPLTLEEAKLRLQKSRREALEPKPISAGTHGSYVWNAATGKYEFDAQAAALGGASETAYIRKLRSLSTMADDPSNPLLQKAAVGELARTSGAKDTAQLQSMRRYFTALDHGEEPLPEDKQLMQIIVNRSIRGSSEGGYYPLNAPLPGATGQTPPASPSTPAPGGMTAPSGPTGQPSATAPRAQSLAPSAASTSYHRWFQGAGESYAKQTMDGMLRDDPGAIQPHTKAALRGFLSAYPRQMEVVDALPGSAESQLPLAVPAPSVVSPSAEPLAREPGPTMLTQPTAKRQAETIATQRRAEGLPAYTHDEVAMAKRLATRGVIPSGELASMSDADFTKVQDYLDAKKQEPLFQRRVKEAEAQIGALDSIDMAESVSGDLFPLLNTSTVGLGGLISRAWTTVGTNLGLIKDPYTRQTLKQAVDSTENLLKMARERGDIQEVLKENPKAAQALVDPGAQGVQVIAGVLEYLHAAALKKAAAAAGGRSGITVEDIRRATSLFDPTSLFADPIGSKKKIVTLQATFLRREKDIVSEALRLKGIDPVTRKPVKGFHFSSDPGGDLPVPTPQEDLDLLRSPD